MKFFLSSTNLQNNKMAKLYTIIDEPRSGLIQKIIVTPIYPLLCMMIVGSSYGYLWFLINSFALKKLFPVKELKYIIMGIAVTVLYASIFIYLKNDSYFNISTFKYLLLPLTLWKMYIGYSLFSIQSTDYEIYNYFNELDQSNSWRIHLIVGIVLFKLDDFLMLAIKNSLFLTLLVK